MRFFTALCVGCVAGKLSYGQITNAHFCGVEKSTNPLHRNPWTVLIEFYKRGQRLDVRCGGTLVGRRTVITAAHCVKTLKYHRLAVRLGEYDLESKIDCVDGVCADEAVKINVSNVIAHAGFDGKGYDIAVLTLEKDAPYTDFIRPACLPMPKKLKNGTKLIASGWGEVHNTRLYSEVKKYIPLPLWRIKDCKRTYRRAVLPERIICAGGENGIDTCRGDSGGPLVLNGELFGVTSAGSVNCGEEGKPGLYTSVVEYLDWIVSVVNVL